MAPHLGHVGSWIFERSKSLQTNACIETAVPNLCGPTFPIHPDVCGVPKLVGEELVLIHIQGEIAKWVPVFCKELFESKERMHCKIGILLDGPPSFHHVYHQPNFAYHRTSSI